MKYHNAMNIFIVGGGEIGTSLAVQLAKDGYKLTLIDREGSIVDNMGNTADVICYQGNGASYATLKELNASDADMFIAVTNSDELNILSCMTAHMMGAKHTIARVRDVDYASQNRFYKDKLGLSMTINPELATALEVYRLLRFPLATRVEVFAGGRAELVEMSVKEGSPLSEKTLIEINQSMGINLLICAVVRDGDAFVPKGDTRLHSGDILYLTGAAEEFRKSFKKLKPCKCTDQAGNYGHDCGKKQGSGAGAFRKHTESCGDVRRYPCLLRFHVRLRYCQYRRVYRPYGKRRV